MGDKIKKMIAKRLPIFLLIIILLIIYWRWFLPGLRVANDFPSVSDVLLKTFMELPYVWLEKPSEGLGEYTIFTLWSYPFNFLAGILANLGFGFVIQERILFLVPFLLFGALGFWRLSGNLGLSSDAKLISTLFYLANTYILLLVDGGQLNVALAYAFFPVCFLSIEQSIKSNLKSKLLAGFSVTFLGFFDIRFVYILFLLTAASFFYRLLFLDAKNRLIYISSWIKSGLVITIILFGLNAYWLLPYFKQPLAPDVYAKLTETTFTSFSNLGHGMLMLGPHWFKNVFGEVSPLKWEFTLIPVLVFLTPILRPKSVLLGFWLIIALISVFLTKGATRPFPDLYPWLYHNIPGFSLFRDSSKFNFLVTLSYAVILGITFDEIRKRIKSVRIKYLFLIFTFLYLILLIKPVWSGQMTGTFSEPPFQKEYSQFAQILTSDTQFSRVFWIPAIAPLSYLTLEHPSVEASRLVQRRPFAAGTVGSYEFINYLREAPYMGEIFDVSGIGYIVYPYLDIRREDPHPDKFKYYDTFSNQLTNLSWLSKVWESPIPLWKVKQHRDKFFLTDNVWLVLGSDHIYNEATKSAKLKLSDNALIFVDEHPGLGNTIDKLPEAKIILGNKTTTDLATSFIDSSNLIFPAKNLGYDPDQSGWWKREAKDLIKWRDFLQSKHGIDNLDFDLGGGWAVGEGSLKLKVKSEKLKKNHVLLARVLESTRSGQLKFYQGDSFVGEINTRKEGNNIRWFEVGQLPKNGGNLEIRSTGDINVVNALAILEKEEWLKLQNKVRNLSNRVTDFIEENTKQKDTLVTYQQINPTRYKVSIKNLTDPSFIVFSQSYDGFWKMDGQKSLPVYSLLNGFRIEKDGEYIVEFEVQKYVYPGLVISLVTLIVTAYLLLFHKYKR